MNSLPRPTSSLTITAALVSIVAIVAAAVLFASGDDSLERLAVLVGVVGLVLPSLTGALRSDQAATSSHRAAEQTNGSLDARIAEAVAAALQARRRSDTVTVVHAERAPDPDPLTLPEAPAG